LSPDIGRRRVKKVSVTLSGLDDETQAPKQGDLFSGAAAPANEAAVKTQRQKFDKISSAIDDLNRKFGRDTISLGSTPQQRQNRDTGTKIAFTRIPDMEEFLE